MPNPELRILVRKELGNLVDFVLPRRFLAEFRDRIQVFVRRSIALSMW